MKTLMHIWQRSLKYATLLRFLVCQMKLLDSAYSHSHWQERPRGGFTHLRVTIENHGRSRWKVSKEILPRVLDCRRESCNLFISSVPWWISEWSIGEVQRFIEKNSHPWVFRANSIEYVYRWAETTNQATVRCFCWGKDKTEDPKRSNWANWEHVSQWSCHSTRQNPSTHKEKLVRTIITWRFIGTE